MARRVAVVGIGSTRYSIDTSEYSFKELMFEAAVKAYDDAGIDPRRDIDAIVSASEDFWEGVSIFDEYVPDQLGGVLKPVFTVTGDGLLALIHGYMLIKTGYFDVVAVEAHSKASDIVDINNVWRIALDPLYHRKLIDNPHVFAGLEMMGFMDEFNVDRDTISAVVSKNRYYALRNPLAQYGARISIDMVNESDVVSDPLRSLDISSYSDGATVIVLASGEKAAELDVEPIWVEGVGWRSSTPYIEEWDLPIPIQVREAGEMAYRMANIGSPFNEIDVAEVDDRYSYRELQSILGLRLIDGYTIDEVMAEGVTSLDGELPVNVSGGYLGHGYPLLAGGLLKAYNIILQLRGEAQRLQVPDAEKGLAMTRMEFPSPTAIVAIFGR